MPHAIARHRLCSFFFPARHNTFARHPLRAIFPGRYGKRFHGAAGGYAVDPLIHDDGHGGLIAVAPLPEPLFRLTIGMRFLRSRALSPLVLALTRFLRTSRPRARLELIEYRGVKSAAMVYNDLHVFDAFKKVDDDTVLGLMVMQGEPENYIFWLRRDGSGGAATAGTRRRARSPARVAK